MASRRLLLAAAGALLTVAATACTPEAADSDDPTLPPVDARDEYVAIGDSYTAAPYTGRTLDPGSGCLRSAKNYPQLVAEELGYELEDVSCGGASTESVTSTQTPLDGEPQPPQADALSSSTDLVTISLGGNDFGVFQALIVHCVNAAGSDPDGAPCTELADRGAGVRLERRLEQIRKRLVGVIAEVTERAPDARVVVVGYPQIFPKRGTCDQLPLATGDYSLARRINEQLVAAQRNAAKQAKVEYVDAFTGSAGHDICGKDPWIAGAKPTRDDGAIYHPYPEEQRFVADLLVDLLR